MKITQDVRGFPAQIGAENQAALAVETAEKSEELREAGAEGIGRAERGPAATNGPPRTPDAAWR